MAPGKSKRCQCSGTGKTLDRKESELQGVPVYKTCKRCEGRGLAGQNPPTHTAASFQSYLACRSVPGVIAGNLSMKAW
jgi:DnaJ-class molecular chaperone